MFKPKDTLEEAIQKFQQRNPEWIINFKGKDWRVLLAYIRRENIELADDIIEKPNAFYIMLRNVSLALIFLAVLQVVEYFSTQIILRLALALTFIIVSVLIAREAKIFQMSFFQMIFETILSHRINLLILA